MKTLIVVFALIVTSLTGFAQDGYVIVHRDQKVDQLLQLYSQHHNSFSEKEGFRIQILASTMSDKAYATESDFKYKYGQNTYLTFKSPYFKLRVGDFTDRLEAYRFLQQIKSKYPGAFLVTEMVKLH